MKMYSSFDISLIFNFLVCIEYNVSFTYKKHEEVPIYKYLLQDTVTKDESVYLCIDFFFCPNCTKVCNTVNFSVL